MTQPVQEPSQGRTDQGQEWRSRQLFRRPSTFVTPTGEGLSAQFRSTTDPIVAGTTTAMEFVSVFDNIGCVLETGDTVIHTPADFFGPNPLIIANMNLNFISAGSVGDPFQLWWSYVGAAQDHQYYSDVYPDTTPASDSTYSRSATLIGEFQMNASFILAGASDLNVLTYNVFLTYIGQYA